MTWENEVHLAAQLFDQGKHREAAEIFRRLSEREDLADGHRAIMGVNLATTYDKMGDVDGAVGCYDYAAGVALRMYVWTREEQANYLFKQNRLDEAIDLWEHLLALDLVAADRREVIQQNLNAAQQRRGG